MRVSIVPRRSLDAARLGYITERLFAEEHELDTSPRSVWHLQSYAPSLYAVVLIESQQPIGILYAAGPKNAVDASWWIDSRFRGKGYAAEAVDLLATLLKADGVTGVGPILIVAYEENHTASSKLVTRLKRKISER